MRDAFFQALYYSTPPRIFGRRVLPFSLSHSFLLSGLENGIVHASEGSRSDLLHAVWVCGMDHKSNSANLLNPPLFRMMWFAALSKRYDYETERLKFMQYVSDFLEVPEHWQGESDGKGFRAPWQFHFVMTAAANFGATIDQAWNMPVALARCYYDVWAESQGDKSLVSQSEIRNIARMKEAGIE
jgi:hypothetical protein